MLKVEKYNFHKIIQQKNKKLLNIKNNIKEMHHLCKKRNNLMNIKNNYEENNFLLYYFM